MCASSARNLKSKWRFSVLVFESCILGWEYWCVFGVGKTVKLVDASKVFFRENFMITVGGFVWETLEGCCKFWSYKLTLWLQFMCVHLQWAIWNWSGASVFLFFESSILGGEYLYIFLGYGILWNWLIEAKKKSKKMSFELVELFWDALEGCWPCWICWQLIGRNGQPFCDERKSITGLSPHRGIGS